GTKTPFEILLSHIQTMYNSIMPYVLDSTELHQESGVYWSTPYF
ncbi:9950_t:CDS:1, partial [Ambispora leptoticha]